MKAHVFVIHCPVLNRTYLQMKNSRFGPGG